MFTLEPSPIASDLAAAFRTTAPACDGGVAYVGSGKAALRLVFQHLKMRGVLENKMAPIIVPSWLGTWVYSTLLPFGFPVLDDQNAKAALVYHQYGFPQDMDRVRDIAATRGITLVEDCAHACAGEYKGAPLGTFADYAIYSFSKFAFCFALGGVRSSAEGFEEFLHHEITQSSAPLRWGLNSLKYFDEDNARRTRPLFPRLMNGLRAMAYARYPDQAAPGPGAVSLWQWKRDSELAARRDNYRQLRIVAERWDICDHLEKDGVFPYAVPLNVPLGKVGTLTALLAQRGIAAQVNRFDFARCLFVSDYRPSVLVPVHSQMTGAGMDRLCDSLDRIL